MRVDHKKQVLSILNEKFGHLAKTPQGKLAVYLLPSLIERVQVVDKEIMVSPENTLKVCKTAMEISSAMFLLLEEDFNKLVKSSEAFFQESLNQRENENEKSS